MNGVARGYKEVVGNNGCKPEPINLSDAIQIAIDILKTQRSFKYKTEMGTDGQTFVISFHDIAGNKYIVPKSPFFEGFDIQVHNIQEFIEKRENFFSPKWGGYFFDDKVLMK